MKFATKILLFASAVFLTVLPVGAQSTYSFTTSLGSGSFTLNTNNLVFTGSNGSAAGYTDSKDTLTFEGIGYTNLDFSVFNNSFLAGFGDGFQILVNKSPYNSSSTLELDVHGSGSVVNGVSVSDLLTVLSSFDFLETNSFFSEVLYYHPNTGYQESGTIISFQLLSASTISNFGMQTNRFGFNISGATNATVVVEACSNVINPVWSPVQTNTLTNGSYYFSDSTWTNYPGRFYRVKTQ